VWVLHKIGKVLVAVAEAMAAAAVVFMALWLLVKGVAWLVKQLVTHPRTTITLGVLLAWWHYLGWPSLAITAGTVTLALIVWWRVDVVSFDRWAGRRIRSWWQRWTVYAPKLPGWLHACGLSMKDDSLPAVVTVNLVGRRKIRRERHATQIACIRRDVFHLDGAATSKEFALVITSSPAGQTGSASLHTHVRQHWGIENKNHYVRDTVWRKDDNQAYAGHGPQSMAALRNLAMGLFRLNGIYKKKRQSASAGTGTGHSPC
jgi:hypothetical protein